MTVGSLSGCFVDDGLAGVDAHEGQLVGVVEVLPFA
jgi:hypothetical protein